MGVILHIYKLATFSKFWRAKPLGLDPVSIPQPPVYDRVHTREVQGLIGYTLEKFQQPGKDTRTGTTEWGACVMSSDEENYGPEIADSYVGVSTSFDGHAPSPSHEG